MIRNLVDEITFNALVLAAMDFLRVGTVSLSDWVDMHDAERKAFLRAAEMVEAEQAMRRSMSNNPIEASRTYAYLDDGELHSELQMEREICLVAEAAARAKSSKP